MTLRLYVHAPAAVFAAQINQPTIDYPIDQVGYDNVTTGVYTSVKVGQTILFGSAAGLSDRGRQRVRKAPTADTIYFGRSSKSHNDGDLMVYDDEYITVLNDFRVWSKTPSITVSGTTATVLKDGDIAYVDQTDEPPPVANMGAGVAATIDSGTSVITVDFDGTNSFAVSDGAVISTYLWDVSDGTITVGTTASSSITATFPAGFRWVHLTVTDDNGNTHYTHRPVYARDPASDTTVSAFTVESHRITAFGQELSFRILEDLAEATYPDGTLVMFWEDEPATAADRSHMKFIGWHRTDPTSLSARETGYIRDTVINCLDVAGRLKEIHGYTQLVENDATPANWGEMSTLNADKYMHYLLHWHSTALDLADWTDSGTGANMAATTLSSDPDSIFNQVNEMATLLTPDYYLTCNTLGQLRVIVDPMLAVVGVDRTTTVQVALAEDDWSDIKWTHQRTPRLYWLWGGAIKAGNTFNSDGELDTLFSVAPGTAPGIGEQELRHERGLAKNQGDLNLVTGHRYARANAPNSMFRITFADGDPRGIEPADMTWVTLTIGTNAEEAQRQLAYNAKKGLPHELNIRYSHEPTGLVKTIELLWEAEEVGEIATTFTPEKSTITPSEGDWWPDDYWDDNAGSIEQPAGDPTNIQQGVQELALIDHAGHIYTTSDFQTLSASGGPTWTDNDMVITEEVYDFVVDPFSPGYRGTGTDINGWIISENAIYRITDIFGTPAKATQHTFGTQCDVAGCFRTIEASFGRYFDDEATNPWIVCVSHYANKAGHTGTWAIYSKDAGVTWSTEVQLTAHYPTAGVGTYEEIAVYVSPRTPGFAITTAYSSTAADPGVATYSTTDWGATWGLHATAPSVSSGNRMPSCIMVPYNDNADENILWNAHTQRLSPLQHEVYRNIGMSGVAQSPNDGTRNYGPGRKWGLRASDTDRQKMVMAGRGNDTSASTSGDRFGVWTTENNGGSWVERFAPVTTTRTPRSATFTANSETEIVLFGRNMYVAWSGDMGATIDGRSGSGGGSLPSTGNWWIRGICGGQT